MDIFFIFVFKKTSLVFPRSAIISLQDFKLKMPDPKRMTRKTYLGIHIIAELFGCENITSIRHVRSALKKAAHLCGATVLHSRFHKFIPHGFTGYLLLAESHISIHTWPEHGYVALDIFTCGNMQPKKAAEYLKKEFAARRMSIREIKRGRCGKLDEKH